MSATPDDELIERYLCDELDDETRARVELRLFEDAAFLEAVEHHENDWLDRHARGELRATERARFERGYLVTEERRARAAFARALQRAARARGTAARPRLGPATWAALAAAALVLAAVWPRAEPERPTSVALARSPSPSPISPLAAPRPESAPVARSTRVVLLVAAALRGVHGAADAPLLRLLPDETDVVLEAPLDFDVDGRAGFRASLETVAGAQLFVRDGLRARLVPAPARVRVRVPATVLRPGDLLVRLTLRTPGAPDEDAGTFLLRVRAR